MKKLLFFGLLASTLLASCQHLPFNSLTSTTYIKAKDAFLLGNNEHGKFSAKMKNISKFDLEVWLCPIAGGQHSPLTVKPNEVVRVSVDRNTALRIDNKSEVGVEVELFVQGDTGLSMGYTSQKR